MIQNIFKVTTICSLTSIGLSALLAKYFNNIHIFFITSALSMTITIFISASDILFTKLPRFKDINIQEKEAIQKIALLCEEKKFQYALLNYLEETTKKMNFLISTSMSGNLGEYRNKIINLFNNVTSALSEEKYMDAAEMITDYEMYGILEYAHKTFNKDKNKKKLFERFSTPSKADKLKEQYRKSLYQDQINQDQINQEPLEHEVAYSKYL